MHARDEIVNSVDPDQTGPDLVLHCQKLSPKLSKFFGQIGLGKQCDPDQTAPLVRLLPEEQSDQGLHCLPFGLIIG